MNPRWFSFFQALGLASGLLLAASVVVSAAPTNSPPTTVVAGEEQFLFLTLRYRTGAVSVVETKVMPGTLKPQRESGSPGALIIRLEQADGVSVWGTTIDNPVRVRYEYEDPAQPGTMRVKEEMLDDVEFIVRTPVVAGARQLSVYQTATNTLPKTLALAPAQLLLKHPLPAEAIR